ncbi:helix-turn-helix transcriptional regulator [Mucilaginibacter sp.]|uniref:helix-turn-helix domain-containing protein n=1 Tax=Mucilaginibacter sp. TaxID=1882438 RepID=UPI00326531ED
MNHEETYNQAFFIKVSARIKELRIAKGYSNYEHFAFKFGFSRSQIARYEKGEDLRLSTLVRILVALEVSPKEFFKGFDL